MMNLKEISYKNYGKCIELSNKETDLVITTEIGPRIIRYGFTGQENMFCENQDFKVKYNDKDWHLLGGHRLWHSPESYPRNYIPDDEPVECSNLDSGIKVTQKIEKWSQISKEMQILLDDKLNKVKIIHTLYNKNAFPVEMGCWALTLMAQGGISVIPQSTKDTGYIYNRSISLWPYSKMDDSRIHWGNKYIVLSQDKKNKEFFKLGISNEDGWAAYFNNNSLFIKRFEFFKGEKYPDNGVSYESFLSDFTLEMESLSPLKILQPQSSISHIEEWELINSVEKPEMDESYIDISVKKYINKNT